MASLTLRSVKGSPLTNNEIDGNFTNLDDDIATRLLASDYNAADVLTKIKTVDGVGSGLDADLLDGLSSSSSNTGSTIVARDSSGNFAANQITAAQLIGPLYLGTSDTVVFEGSADNAFETTLTVTNPTADRTITLPDLSGTVVTTGDTGTVTNAMLAGSIANAKLSNSTITIDGNAVSLGGSVSITGANLTWTGTQTFRDNRFIITDDVDNTKVLNLQLSNITTGTTRTLTVPDASGTIATQAYVGTYVSGGTAGGAFTTLSSTGNTTFNALLTAGETTTISATAATGIVNYDLLTQGVVYYTTAASANWTLNIRGNSGTTLNSVMAVGETRTVTFLVTQGSTAYYNNILQIDGTTTGVTTKWQGAAPIAGNPSGIDVYTYSILKTGSATYTVLASQVPFK